MASLPAAANDKVLILFLAWGAAPTGPLFTQFGFDGSAIPGAWVIDGATFYLQDVTGVEPLTADHTLATAVIHLQQK